MRAGVAALLDDPVPAPRLPTDDVVGFVLALEP
jgi:hypothetical protein